MEKRGSRALFPYPFIALRPLRGLSVAEWDGVVGKKLARDVNERDPITASDLA